MLPDNGNIYVTRQELNGTLRRIETTGAETREEVRGIRREMTELRECVHTRVPWDEFNEHKKDDEKEHKELGGRPSWVTTFALSVMSGVSLGLLGALVGVLVR
jgi:hypothetical protein